MSVRPVLRFDPALVRPYAFEDNVKAKHRGTGGYEVANRVHLATREDVIVSRGLLQHKPHPFNVVPSKAPVPLSIKITEEKDFELTMFDLSERDRDLPRYKFLTAKRGFVVEQNAERCMDSVAFAIADRHPMAVKLGCAIWATVVTSDAGLLAYRELDDALGLSVVAGEMLADARAGKNGRHALVGLLRQSVFGRLAGYEDVNDAERLRHDPAMRWIVGGTAAQGCAASPSQVGRFETQWLATEPNLCALTDLSGQWIDLVHSREAAARHRARHGFQR